MTNLSKELHVTPDDLPWKKMQQGVYFKLLRICPVTGTWVLLFRHEKDTSYLPHKHIGAGEYYIIKGRIDVRGGAQNGGISAVSGDYGYEPNGVIHEKTYIPEPTEYLFINHGPLQFLDQDGNTQDILDWQGVEAMWNNAEVVTP